MNYGNAAEKMAMMMNKPKKAKPEPKREMPMRGGRTATNKAKKK
jgi:hypothetical protein